MTQLKSGSLLQGGKYKIEKVLGQGGFGITYQAITQVEVKGPLGVIRTEVSVAIKEFFMKDLCNRDEHTSQVSVPSSGSIQQVDNYRKKFRKEAQNLSKLNHPNIVKVLDVFNENGTSYYVMEYIDGGSLQQRVKQQGALSEKMVLMYTQQLTSALEYMHRNHVCHLDIKPGNIMINNERTQVKLIDFGLSKQYDDEGSQTSSTPVGISEGYAPTEQYELGGVSEFSPATDIYSLGATLFFLLSGVKPPKASLVLNEGLPELPATISAATKHAIETAMNPRRKDRPQTIRNFLALLNYTEEEIVVEAVDEDTIIKDKEPKKKKNTDKNAESLFAVIAKNRKYATIMPIIAIILIGLWSVSLVLSRSSYEHPDFPHLPFILVNLFLAACSFYLAIKTTLLSKSLKIILSIMQLTIFVILAFIPFVQPYMELVPGKGYKWRTSTDKRAGEDYIREADAIPVCKWGTWGVIDTYGNVIVPYILDYDWVGPYDGEYASIAKKRKRWMHR